MFSSTQLVEFSHATLTNLDRRIINHFTEWLDQFTRPPSTEIIDAVIREMRIDNIPLQNVDSGLILQYVRARRINKYAMEFWCYIVREIKGEPQFSVGPEIKRKLLDMFVDIQIPFRISRVRKGFFSYGYVVLKFTELLYSDGVSDLYLPFGYMKSKEKYVAYDKVWIKICKLLGWKFISSWLNEFSTKHIEKQHCFMILYKQQLPHDIIYNVSSFL